MTYSMCGKILLQEMSDTFLSVLQQDRHGHLALQFISKVQYIQNISQPEFWIYFKTVTNYQVQRG